MILLNKCVGVLHKYDKWITIAAIETKLHHGGAFLQTRECSICGMRQLRKTNSVTSSNISSIRVLLEKFLEKLSNASNN